MGANAPPAGQLGCLGEADWIGACHRAAATSAYVRLGALRSEAWGQEEVAMSRYKIFHAAVLFGAAAGLAACGEDGGGTAAAASLVACDLLTPAEVGEAIGKTVNDGRGEPAVGGGENQGAMTTCVWETPPNEVPANNLDLAAALSGQMVVTFTVWSWPDNDGAVRYVQAMRDAAAQTPGVPPAEAVSIGDEAVWIGGPVASGGMLHGRNGDVTFTLSVSALGAGATDTRAATESLARTAVAKL
jgi:hypothetical protein